MKHWMIGLIFLSFTSVSALAQWGGGIHGFVETAAGLRTSDESGTRHDDMTLLETRVQLKERHFFEKGYLGEKRGLLDVKVEALSDGYFDWKTDVSVRELNLDFSPLPNMDFKIGRQILTWGTGDYLFINDMFPKDYISFFSGRDDEYLKKPSDAIRSSFYFNAVNFDAVVIPFFEPNTTAKGDRLSFYDTFQGGIAGESSDRYLIEPPHQASNMEYALRAFRNLGSYEVAAYFFHGFYKNPVAYKDELNRQLFYPRVDVYGTSLRGPFASGIANVEAGYYNSRQDTNGDNRLIPNSMWKAVAGYSKDLGNDWSIGFQYMYEQYLDYDAYKNSLLATDLRFDEIRHLVTQRITKLFKNQTVECSLFNFYSPSDRDGYLRTSLAYDITDQWKATVGANVPWGEDDYTEFGQMKKDKNIYFCVRYNF